VGRCVEADKGFRLANRIERARRVCVPRVTKDSLVGRARSRGLDNPTAQRLQGLSLVGSKSGFLSGGMKGGEVLAGCRRWLKRHEIPLVC